MHLDSIRMAQSEQVSTRNRVTNIVYRTPQRTKAPTNKDFNQDGQAAHPVLKLTGHLLSNFGPRIRADSSNLRAIPFLTQIKLRLFDGIT